MDEYEEAEFRALKHEMDRMEEEARDEALIAKYENQIAKEKTVRGCQVRDCLTEEEHEALVRFGDEFSDRLGLLVADIVSRFPEEVEYFVLAYLQDRCSIYGTRYDEYLNELRRRNDD